MVKAQDLPTFGAHIFDIGRDKNHAAACYVPWMCDDDLIWSSTICWQNFGQPGPIPFLFCSASREVAEVKWIIEIEVCPICGWSPRKDILIDIKSISLSVV